MDKWYIPMPLTLYRDGFNFYSEDKSYSFTPAKVEFVGFITDHHSKGRKVFIPDYPKGHGSEYLCHVYVVTKSGCLDLVRYDKTPNPIWFPSRTILYGAECERQSFGLFIANEMATKKKKISQ